MADSIDTTHAPAAAGTLIMPRRNFLIRALGFTAAGATVAVPIITMDDARKRYEHHLKGLQDAMRDLFPTQHVEARGSCLDAADIADCQAKLLVDPNPQLAGCLILMAGKYIDWNKGAANV